MPIEEGGANAVVVEAAASAAAERRVFLLDDGAMVFRFATRRFDGSPRSKSAGVLGGRDKLTGILLKIHVNK